MAEEFRGIEMTAAWTVPRAPSDRSARAEVASDEVGTMSIDDAEFRFVMI